MDAIILAGGKGTRLQKVISDVPKPLAPINGKPFLDILIEKLKKNKLIENIILSIGYKKDQIIERYKNLKNIFFSEENFPLLTGGAIKHSLSKTKTDEVLILNGDTYVDYNLEDFLNYHKKSKADITILYKKKNDVSRFGSLLMDPHTQKIISFNEKLNMNNGCINAGVYIINKSIFEKLKVPDIFSFEIDFMPKALIYLNIYGFETNLKFIDIGTEDSYYLSKKYLKKYP
jgi:D-glycero-alpha-D-manno-heptose 1-phosphate guanylyltransferase